MRLLDFFDGAQSETAPTIGNIVASGIVVYPDDATYEATEQGAPAEGNIYFNSTTDFLRYYNGSTWIDLVDDESVQDILNKTLQNCAIDADQNVITNIDNDDIKAGAAIDATKIADGSVDNTEYQYLDGVTSPIQTQLDAKQETSEKGQPNGYASLNGSGLVPAEQLPSFVDDVLEYADLASFPVTGESDKIYIAQDTNNTYRWSGSTYVQISASGANQSLSNLTDPTAVNQDLVGDTDGARDLGTPAIKWGNVLARVLNIGNLTQGLIGDFNNNLSLFGFGMRTNDTSIMTVQTATNSTANATATANLYLLTGNKTAGTGNSGDIVAQTGTSTGGQRGAIKLKNGSEGTAGHVWTSTGTDGEGEWAAASGGSGQAQENFALIKNGTATYDATLEQLTWDEDLFISIPGLPKEYHRIAAQTINISADQAAYVTVDRAATGPTTLTVTVDDIVNIVNDGNKIIFARAEGFRGPEGLITEQLAGAATALILSSSSTADKRAQELIPDASKYVSNVGLRLFQSGGVTGTFDIAITADNAGLPGAILDVITVDASTLPSSAPASLQTYIFNRLAYLEVGTSYWLEFRNPSLAGGSVQIVYSSSNVYAGTYKVDTGSGYGAGLNIDLIFQINGESKVEKGLIGLHDPVQIPNNQNVDLNQGIILNKTQTKILSTAHQVNGVVTDLTCNNLVIGRWYEVSGLVTVILDTIGPDPTLLLNFEHNSTNIYGLGQQIAETADTGVDALRVGFSFKFKAEATSLTLVTSSTSANSYLAGSGTKNDTHLIIEERKDLIETNEF